MNTKSASIRCGRLAVLLALAVSVPALAEDDNRASVVKVEKMEEGYRLLRNGEPYFVKGVGYMADRDAAYLDQLAEAGGNSLRTWGIDQMSEKLLDQAHERGLTVAVGIWLGHPRHGFDYGDARSLARQKKQVREAVERFKDHPAVLLWGLGNEMNMEGADPKIFRHVEELAQMVKKIDPNHPVMTVLAELGGRRGDKAVMLHELCPSVDIVGINSYAGINSVNRRYTRAGCTKPYIVTEHGPRGHWEAESAYGTPLEESSTAKAERYREGYQNAVADKELALGAYTFLWGRKQETTATWYGMFLKDGSRLGAIDVMTELWSGKPPKNRAPLLQELNVESEEIISGKPFTAHVKATDPDGDKLEYEWFLRPAKLELGAGGDFERDVSNLDGAIVENKQDRVTVMAPEVEGRRSYRLFAYVRDGQGNAAVHNVVILVHGSEQPAAAPRPESLPLVVYDDAESKHYEASGYMGNYDALKVDEAARSNPHSGETCIKVTYDSDRRWAGVAWQSPANNWGKMEGGYDFSGAKRLTFWARGEKGGEKVEFLCGLLGEEALYSDTTRLKTSHELTTQWRKFTFEIVEQDLRRMVTGFGFVVVGQGDNVTFYLDDIRYE